MVIGFKLWLPEAINLRGIYWLLNFLSITSLICSFWSFCERCLSVAQNGRASWQSALLLGISWSSRYLCNASFCPLPLSWQILVFRNPRRTRNQGGSGNDLFSTSRVTPRKLHQRSGRWWPHRTDQPDHSSYCPSWTHYKRECWCW